VRALRLDRGVPLDEYHVGNPDSNGPPMNDRQLDPEMVSTITAKSATASRRSCFMAVFCGRNLYVALRDEILPGIAAINEAISDNLPTLFRMACSDRRIAPNSFRSRCLPPFKNTRCGIAAGHFGDFGDFGFLDKTVYVL
jgi:hypothetical protein